MKNILIIRPGALGDTILSFDLLKNLKEYGFNINFVGNADYVSLISYFNLGKGISIDQALFLPLFLEEDDFRNIGNKLNLLLDFLEQFDIIILIYHKKEELYERLKRFTKKKIIYLSSIPTKKVSVRRYLLESILYELNQRVKYYNYCLNFSKKNNDILIHPGAGSKHKIWDWKNYFLLIDYLLNHNMNITIVEGPAEPNTKENFYIYFKNFINYIKIRTTFEFIHLVQNHGFYVGNDSGLTHLASFLGINGIAIFGTTDPWLWHPIPVIKCLYESREDGIFFPSFEFLRDYIRFIGF